MVAKASRIISFIILFAISLFAGSDTRSTFTLVNDGVADSNLIVRGSGVGLAEKYSATVKLFGDTLPGTPNRTNCPDIVMKNRDTLDAFFVDSSSKQVKTQRIVLISGGIAVAGVQNKAFDLKNNVWYPYLHVDQGANGYLASYIIDASNNNYIMGLNNGTKTIETDSSGTSQWIASTQCHFEGDTFLVMSVVKTKTATLHKIYSRGSSLIKTDSVLAVENASPLILNGALAVDSAGLILAAFTRGTFIGAKTVTCQIYNRDLSAGPVDTKNIPIAENAFYYYDDVSVVSYGVGKFAMVSWDAKGVLLHTITVSGTVTHDTLRVINKTGIKYCTIAASNRYLVIACMGDVDGNTVRCVEGIRYLLVNGTPDSAKSISFSDPSTPVITYDSSFSSAMNATVDDSGVIGIVWRNQYKVAGAIWAHRPIRYAKSFYRSPVDSLKFDNDSIWFNPLTVAYNPSQYWNTDSYLRFGTSVQACTTASWISFTDTSVLSQNRTRNCFYQTKVYLNRNTSGVIDSFATPSLTSYTVSWNVKPRFLAFDSLRAGAIRYVQVISGTTVDAISRRDSLQCAVRIHDADNGDAVALSLSQPTTPQDQTLTGGPDFSGTFSVHPFNVSDTVYTCTLSVEDNAGWNGTPFIVNCRTRNSLPVLSLDYRHRAGAGGTDSVSLIRDTTCIIQEEDTVLLRFTVSDSNDVTSVRAMVRYTDGVQNIYHDSISTGQVGLFAVAADTLVPVDTVRYAVLASDTDTTIGIKVNMIVNHRPVIADVVYASDTINAGDTVGVVLDDTAWFSIAVHDTDCYFGDTLTYTLRTPSSVDTELSISTTETLFFVPDDGDTVLDLKVVDRFGRVDSIHFHLSYPWFETSDAENPEYAPALMYLADSLSLIAGSGTGDTVVIPVFNTGRDPLVISAIDFSLDSSEWSKLKVVNNGDDTLVLQAGDSGLVEPLAVQPSEKMTITAYLSAKNLSGDSIRHDTILISTNDPRHRRVVLPLKLEYNDLPIIVSISPYFITNAPYRPFAKKRAYVFPPHAKIALSFSEPMDTAGVGSAITLFSVRDREETGIMQPLPISLTWLQNNTIVHLSPSYASASPYFKLKPPDGMFIPTDSIAIIISDALHDIATTPSGPNHLDVDRDFVRQSGADTVITQDIDSILFSVATVSPSAGEQRFARDGAISLVFSTPFYTESVDTSLVNNRSFRVTSEYNDDKPFAFSSVMVHDDTVTFRLKQELFYLDSVTCSYRSRWIRDSLGYATDNSRDGIDITIFDSLSGDDDLQWGYRVRPIAVTATEPGNESVLTEVSPRITIHFDGTLPSGVIDQDTSKANSSFRIGSGRTGYSSLRSISYLPDSTGFVVQPKLTFFSNDSVYCEFLGFTREYRYASRVNIPPDSTELPSHHEWYFRSGEIGFYTYPNPYKPGSNPRHCREDGPCGIWFKNLHTLGRDLNEVAIAIYTMNAHPVIDTRRKGIRIQFNDYGTENLPQWKWNTRNARGDRVASGLYLYAIFDTKNSVLKKGKLVIVR